MRYKIAAIFLAAAMLLSICGCAREAEPEDMRASPRPTAEDEKTHFAQVWRGDVKYSDMEYEHYEAEWFDEYTAPLYEMAEKGGSPEEFSDADYYIVDELYYVYTLLTLINIQQSAEPDNEEIVNELLYTQELYYTLNDEYWNVMHTLAVSPYAQLMEEAYGETAISWFEAYEPGDEGELGLYSEENALIQEYYRLMAQDEPDTEAVGDVYLQLVTLRREKAELYGYGSYAEYAYDYTYYKDYTPEDSQAVWDGVKQYFVPLMCEYGADAMERAAYLQSSGSVDCGSEAILSAMDRILPDLSSELYTAFRYMMDYGLYDIEYDAGKANTGYTTTLYYVNEPFIFNAAYGEFYDYTDMFHEFGHFANAFYTQSDLLFGMSDNDLCELQSQGLEMLFTHYYDDIFGEYADAARGYVLMDMVYSVVDGALFDEFQQRVYSEPDLTLERVNEIYAGLYEEYGYAPYEGYETEWMGINHNFEDPFYYISYCVSALGALEIYELAQQSWSEAVDKYLTVCAMDTEVYYYSEALREAGFGDIFSPDTYKEIAESLVKGF